MPLRDASRGLFSPLCFNDLACVGQDFEKTEGQNQLLEGAMGMVEEVAEEEEDLGIWEDDAWGQLLTRGNVTEI